MVTSEINHPFKLCFLFYENLSLKKHTVFILGRLEGVSLCNTTKHNEASKPAASFLLFHSFCLSFIHSPFMFSFTLSLFPHSYYTLMLFLFPKTKILLPDSISGKQFQSSLQLSVITFNVSGIHFFNNLL